jgi:hypothetical protein
LYQVITGDQSLAEQCRGELEYLLSKVGAGGTIGPLTDQIDCMRYEYGLALSVLGLGAVAYRASAPHFAQECLRAGQSVADYILRAFNPDSTVDSAMLLAGLARIVAAQSRHDWAALPQSRTEPLSEEISFSVWPNPANGRVSISYRMQPGRTGTLRIIDIAGRQIASFPLDAARSSPGGFNTRTIDLTLLGIPSGRYQSVLESGTRSFHRGLTILR